MKSVEFWALLAALTLLLSAGAFAKSANAGTFDLAESARVGSTQLQPGHYKAEWLGPNGDVHVTILHNGKIVATAEGRMTRLSQPAPYSSVTLGTQENQSKRIEEIDFGKSKEALVLSAM